MARTRKYNIRHGGEIVGVKRDVLGYSNSVSPSTVCSNICTDEVHRGPPYKSGGPLTVTHKKVIYGETAHLSVHWNAPPKVQYFWYDGTIVIKPYPISTDPGPLNLSGWGAKGWNRTFPLHPVYSMGVSLIELRDAPRMVRHSWDGLKDLVRRGIDVSKQSRTFGAFMRDLRRGPKYIAENYLNTSFGWVPFYQDIAAAVSYQEKLAKKLNWLRRHNGKSVRRKVTLDAGGFSEAIPRSIAPGSTVHTSFASQLYAGGTINTDPQNFDYRKSYNRRIWFVAKYRFMIPELLPGNFGKSDHTGLKKELYGLALDPSIIYKVIPWSWLLDWFVNTGTVLQNIYFRAKYQVVAQYAYVMCSENYRYTAPGAVYMNTGFFPKSPSDNVWSGSPQWFTGSSHTIFEFRQREVANPYGFGITFASLSAYQWSILTALGLSRGGKHSAPRA